MTHDDRPKLSRREVLAGGAALLSGAALSPVRALEQVPPQVPRRPLGRTGKQIPILLMGGASGFDARFDPRLAEALRLGINYVDAADCYAGGRCEPAVGSFHVRANARASLWITSKSDRHDVAGFEQTLGESLRRMQTDYVDMYFLHALTDASYLSSDLELALARLKKTGKLRHFGFSCHGGNVPQLLQRASQLAWVDAVMFRYNFRHYGDRDLNLAMDAAHKAGVGLIAMKTQGSEAGLPAFRRFEQTGKWNKFQATLKAVWADARITAAVSHMDTFEKLRENAAAAADRAALSDVELRSLQRYAEATRTLACDGCDHICGPALGGAVRIADTLRYVMYHDAYGEPQRAREAFARLPEEARRFSGVDFSRASAACPHGVDVAAGMQRAREILA